MKKNQPTALQPILKWAGGKRQLLAELRRHMPQRYERYFEPFIGGGALLFDVLPAPRPVLNDINGELANLYRVVRDHVTELITSLRRHRHDKDYFYRLRGLDRSPDFASLSPVEKASRILYLNRTCYNGLFRVNSKGHFNVPFGRYANPRIVDAPALEAMSHYLRRSRAVIRNVDFAEAVEDAGRGDFVYFDPPYHPLSASASFTSYASKGFGAEEQERLRALCDKLDRKGCLFMVSNSYCPFIVDLYRHKRYNLTVVEAARPINAVAKSRGKIREVLVRNYS